MLKIDGNQFARHPTLSGHLDSTQGEVVSGLHQNYRLYLPVKRQWFDD